MGLKTGFLMNNSGYSISRVYISRELWEADMWKTIRSHSRGSKLRLSHPLHLEGLSHSESKCGLWNSNRFWFMSQFGPFLALWLWVRTNRKLRFKIYNLPNLCLPVISISKRSMLNSPNITDWPVFPCTSVDVWIICLKLCCLMHRHYLFLKNYSLVTM